MVIKLVELMRGWKAECRSFPVDKGTLKFLRGNFTKLHGIMISCTRVMRRSQQIGGKLYLLRLHKIPEAP